MSIDKLDLKIIRSLNKNARKSYRDISEEIDVSDTTVRKRIQGMIESGVIKQFNVLLDYHKIGRIIKAFIGIRIRPPQLQEVVNNLKDNPDVQVLYRTTGNVDLFVEVIFGDMEELNTFLESELNIEGITGTEVNIVIGPYKRCPCTGL
jgi:Lrp/AsnC family transcriptional regulator for asnA, asnC and gidA